MFSNNIVRRRNENEISAGKKSAFPLFPFSIFLTVDLSSILNGALCRESNV